MAENLHKNCKSCGATLKNSENFCRRCGANVDYQTTDQPIVLSESAGQDLKKGVGSFRALEVAIVLIIVTIIGLIAVPNFRRCYRQQTRDKACYANMRVILGAIEMYNMDHQDMITTSLDDPTKAGSVLVKGKYLKHPLDPPEIGCNYRIVGDMTGSGYITCDVHGSVEENPLK